MSASGHGPATARKCAKCLQWYAYGTSTIGPCVDSSYPARGAWRDPAHDWRDVPIEEARAGELLRPEPTPKDTGSRPIWPLVIEHLEQQMAEVGGLVTYTKLLIADMRTRDEQGRAKYGVPLTVGDGRDHLVDSYQEALDCAVYLRADCDRAGLSDAERGCSWRLFERAVEFAHALRIRLAIRRGETRR